MPTFIIRADVWIAVDGFDSITEVAETAMPHAVGREMRTAIEKALPFGASDVTVEVQYLTEDEAESQVRAEAESHGRLAVSRG